MIGRIAGASLLALGATTTAAMAQSPAATALGKAAPVAVEEPRDIVAAIYRLAAVDLTKAKPTSPFAEPATRQKYFSKGFDLLVTDAETRAAHEGGTALDFDPVSASQDAELQKVTLKTDLLSIDKAVVSATFLNHHLPTVVTYDFVREGGAWRINDIKGTTEKEAWSVRKILTTSGRQPKALPGMKADAPPKPPPRPEEK